MSSSSSLARQNVRAFFWFRIFFNCRFYYPVYAILFLDLGLSYEQFAWLNVIWAVAIVLLEVPSGALADQLGRRNLVIAASVLMIAELVMICLAPIGGGAVLFALLAANRVLSGAAEAAASGADEALAYDSLPEKGRTRLWGSLMANMMRAMALFMALAFVIGGLVYDPSILRGVFDWLGWELPSRGQTLKWPLYLSLLTSFGALLAALSYRELGHERKNLWESVRGSFTQVLDTGKWILRTPAPLALIAIGVVLDGWARLAVTNLSEVYRLLWIPEGWFGVLGAAAAALGMLTSRWAQKLHRQKSAQQNFGLIFALVALSMASLIWPIPYWGALLLVPIFVGMSFHGYFLSQYLNEVTPSERRATTLSFKGLAMNLAFGLAMVFYALESKAVKVWGLKAPAQSVVEPTGLQEFAASIALWLPFFLLSSLLLWLWLRRRFACSLGALIRKSKMEEG